MYIGYKCIFMWLCIIVNGGSAGVRMKISMDLAQVLLCLIIGVHAVVSIESKKDDLK